MVRTQQLNIECAITRVTEERNLVETEREAFRAFRKRLDDIQTKEPEAPSNVGAVTILSKDEPTLSMKLRAVRQAYRETIMRVSHYDKEYDDSLRESLVKELGVTIANYVTNGGHLTPVIHDALVDATEQGRANRDRFLSLLRDEHESLRTTAEELNRLEARVVELGERIDAAETHTELVCIDETLEQIVQDCGDLSTRRQERIHNRGIREFSGIGTRSLSQYLYDGMETVTPCLVDITSCLETAQYARARCLR